MDIDLVYIWNNSYDENWKRKRDYWADKLGVLIDNCRFMDNKELKYSLRSVEIYMPWIHKIFIIRLYIIRYIYILFNIISNKTISFFFRY